MRFKRRGRGQIELLHQLPQTRGIDELIERAPVPVLDSPEQLLALANQLHKHRRAANSSDRLEHCRPRRGLFGPACVHTRHDQTHVLLRGLHQDLPASPSQQLDIDLRVALEHRTDQIDQ